MFKLSEVKYGIMMKLTKLLNPKVKELILVRMTVLLKFPKVSGLGVS
jgi:hypothetical protein